MQVANIKCFCKGTDTGSFLKEGDYSGVLSSLDGFLPGLESQIDSLKGEMNGGGLDASAFNLGGFSPLFEMGYMANKNILSAKESISEIKQIIEGDANVHMTNEWGRYHEEVQKCTEEKKRSRDDAKSYLDGLDDNDPAKGSAKSAFVAAEAEYQEHLKELESAGSMLEGLAKARSTSGYIPDILVTGIGTGYTSDGSAAQETQASIYNELSKLGYSRAGICAILANMQAESGFDLTALGDGGTSFGLCQWHDSRWTDLNNYCASHGLDPNTVEGQVAFLDYELQNNYPDFYKQLQSADDSQATAENLARTWCTDFERPADATTRAEERAGYVGTYWERSNGASTGADVISGYSNLASMNESNNKKVQAVKEREFDTSSAGGNVSEAASKACEWAINTANNNDLGYVSGGMGPNQGGYDCTQFVHASYMAAGVDIPEYYNINNENIKEKYEQYGFTWHEGPIDPNELQAGDVLVNHAHHAELYIGNGQKVGAHNDYSGGSGDPSGTEISVDNYQEYGNGGWDGYLRYNGK